MASKAEFKAWAGNKKQLRMEFFYRSMRKKYQILMQGEQPIGNKWNYDAENQKPNKKLTQQPIVYQVEPDRITRAVLKPVQTHFTDHFGDLEPFSFATTRQEALKVLASFITHHLPLFGAHQDVMLEQQPWMFHAHQLLSEYRLTITT